jgi:hypothetical protein
MANFHPFCGWAFFGGFERRVFSALKVEIWSWEMREIFRNFQKIETMFFPHFPIHFHQFLFNDEFI